MHMERVTEYIQLQNELKMRHSNCMIDHNQDSLWYGAINIYIKLYI